MRENADQNNSDSDNFYAVNIFSKRDNRTLVVIIYDYETVWGNFKIRFLSWVIFNIVFSNKKNRVLSDCNWNRTCNHLVHKRTLNHLAKLLKWLSVRLWTKWLWVWVQLQPLKLQISRLLWAMNLLIFRQIWSVNSLWNAYVTW